MRLFLKLFFALTLFFGAFCFFSRDAEAQRRDYLTDEEIELVRDAQDIDLRIDVLTKAIDRRFAVLKIDVGSPKSAVKESGAWGPMPVGSDLDLLGDIKGLLQKAIDDIDNVAAHPPESDVREKGEKTEKQVKKDAQRFPNAVRSLAAAAQRYQPAFKSMLASAKDEKAKDIVLEAIGFCDQIIEAAGKLPSNAPNQKNQR